jgi:hypothetical protein
VEYSGLYSKPKGEVHRGKMLMGPKKEEEKEEEEDPMFSIV